MAWKKFAPTALSVQAAADRLETSRITVYRLMKTNELETFSSSTSARRYVTERSVQQILGRPERMASLRRRQRVCGRRRVSKADRFAAIIDLKQQGFTQAEIGTRLGVSQSRISVIAKGMSNLKPLANDSVRSVSQPSASPVPESRLKAYSLIAAANAAILQAQTALGELEAYCAWKPND